MTADAQRKRNSAVFSQKITHIYAPEGLPDHLLLVGSGGQITVIDAELNIQASSSASQPDDTVPLRHFIFPRRTCAFLPTQTLPSGVVSVSVLQQNSNALVSISAVDTQGHAHSLGSCTIPLGEADVVDVSFSAAGCLTVLTRSGRWSFYRLTVSSSSTLSVSPLCSPIHLASLSFLPSGARSASHAHEISLLALTSSHVLLAGITVSQPEMVLLLWDTQYGVLLAEQRFPCPSHLHRGKERGVHMELVASSSAAEPNQALLVLHPADAKSQDSEDPRATSVLVVPLSVPKTSTIANALGRATIGQAWLRSEADGSQSRKGVHLTLDIGGLEPEQVKTLEAMLKAQEKGRTEQAERHWAGYLEGASGLEAGPPLGHLFVKQLLSVLFLVPPSGREGAAQANAATPYARNAVKYLLERKAVSDAMVEGGLVPALMARNDWNNAALALSTVIDLPEPAVIGLLAKVVTHHRQTASDAMQVDAPSPTSPPALPAFLALCVTYSASPGPLRVALRKHLPDAADIVCVLEVLDGWLERWGAEELSLVPEKVQKDVHGAYVPIFAEKQEQEMPPLGKMLKDSLLVPQMLTFIQAVLDSSFIALLSHPPAHTLIRTLLARLEPELALLSELQSLKGPLQAFASAHPRAPGAGHGRSKAADSQADWHKRRKAQAEHRDMNVGVYQVEELVI
ncbi:hypothetical protein DAEQUDRAFT_813894 [Daedalea quercina L-15889]|uniref:Nucleolar protein 11 n=1 Tax=Daedalea quercina L-15889 TaxID=1314783 RepID=A0A165MS15_9APHY|nr:hypothetical protein DAEQUDRAFT_813894 [Daedalea quercina L-15889]